MTSNAYGAPDRASEYRVARGHLDTGRLTMAHYIWLRSFGWLVHPAIGIQDKPNARIADVGTGPGTWLLELSDQLPATVQFDGFDVSDMQFPPPPFLPKNIRYGHLNIKEDIPETLAGQYDLVAIRNFAVVVDDDNPTPILKRLFKMLKPGGWIQWGEFEVSSDRFHKADPSLSDVHSVKLRQMMRVAEPRLGATYPNNFDEIVANAGFQDAHLEIRRAADADWRHKFHTEHMLFGSLEVIYLAMPEGEQKVRVREAIDAAAEEVRQGVAWDADLFTVVGRKPLS